MSHKYADVIKYEGDNSTFIWKHPAEDFNTLSQLIVHESQEALFFMNGQALDLFGPGRYTLSTENIPKLGKYVNKLTGGESPFHCEVYFINKTVQMSIKWGTDSRVRYIDPETGLPFAIGACGEMNLMVSDSRKLLVKLVGSMNGIAWEERSGENFTKSLRESFRPLISTEVKSNLTQAIKRSGIDLFEIDEHLSELSEVLRRAIAPGFEDYGLTIPQFYLTTVLLPEDDANFIRLREMRSFSFRKKLAQEESDLKISQMRSQAEVAKEREFINADVEAARRKAVIEEETTTTEKARYAAERTVIEAQAEAQKKRLEGLAEAEVMQAQGYSHKDEITAEVQKAYAAGLGQMGANGGGALGDVASLGVTLGAVGGVIGLTKEAISPMFGQEPAQSQPQTAVAKEICPNCGKELPADAKFCFECGTKIEKLGENEMICPACGKKTAKGKFCMECGASLVKKCAECGAEIPNGAKFCLECGTKIE